MRRDKERMNKELQLSVHSHVTKKIDDNSLFLCVSTCAINVDLFCLLLIVLDAAIWPLLSTSIWNWTYFFSFYFLFILSEFLPHFITLIKIHQIFLYFDKFFVCVVCGKWPSKKNASAWFILRVRVKKWLWEENEMNLTMRTKNLSRVSMCVYIYCQWKYWSEKLKSSSSWLLLVAVCCCVVATSNNC